MSGWKCYQIHFFRKVVIISRVFLYINGTFVRRNASRIIIIRKITKRTPLKGWMTHRMSSFREEKKCLRKWGEETQELTQMWSIAFGAKSMFLKQKKVNYLSFFSPLNKNYFSCFRFDPCQTLFASTHLCKY